MLKFMHAILLFVSFGILAQDGDLSEIVEFRVYPGIAGKDSFSICIDLGQEAFAANDASEFRNQILRVTFGELDLTGKTNDAGQIDNEELKVNLAENGKKMLVQAHTVNLGFLLDPQPQLGTFPASCELKISLAPDVKLEKSPRVLFVRELFLKYEKESDKKP